MYAPYGQHARPSTQGLSLHSGKGFYTLKTNLSIYSLEKLKLISKYPVIRHYVHRFTIKGFDKNCRVLGERLYWDRHANPQEHPAVKQLRNIPPTWTLQISWAIQTLHQEWRPIEWPYAYRCNDSSPEYCHKNRSSCRVIYSKPNRRC